MRADIAAEWADALESGEYIQGESALCYIDDATADLRHCCLGVLCELAIQNGCPVVKRVNSDTGDVSFDGLKDALPDSVSKWSGVRSQLGFYSERGDYLARDNDNEIPFPTIAKTIRTNVETL